MEPEYFWLLLHKYNRSVNETLKEINHVYRDY